MYIYKKYKCIYIYKKYIYIYIYIHKKYIYIRNTHTHTQHKKKIVMWAQETQRAHRVLKSQHIKISKQGRN